jgi:hypothetical protein
MHGHHDDGVNAMVVVVVDGSCVYSRRLAPGVSLRHNLKGTSKKRYLENLSVCPALSQKVLLQPTTKPATKQPQ